MRSSQNITAPKTAHPGRDARRQSGLTLVEIIGVLAVMAILAGVLLPAWIASLDKAAADSETATLQSFADALQRNILRSRSIPSETAWVSTIANEAGLSISAVATNSRNQARAFLIDTNGFSPVSLPYAQTSSGLPAPPSSPRLMIVSTLGAALPGAVTANPRPKSADFSQLWNAPPGTVPRYTGSPWNGWNGKPADILVQRLNLSPLFVSLALTSYQSTNTASFALDTNAPLALAPSWPTPPWTWSAVTNWFLRNSELKLFNGAFTNLDSHHLLAGNTSLYYYQNVWCSQLLMINNGYTPPDPSLIPLWQNMLSLANGFLNVPSTGAAVTQTDVVNDFIKYFNDYIAWANVNAANTTWPKDVFYNALYVSDDCNKNPANDYCNMMNDLTTFVAPVVSTK